MGMIASIASSLRASGWIRRACRRCDSLVRDYCLDALEARLLLSGNTEYLIHHPPYLQLGNAAITGEYNEASRGETDQIDILWQTVPNGGAVNDPQDTFQVKYRKVTADEQAS